jgi:hypothetical protein
MRNPKAETFSWNPWNLNKKHPTPRTAWPKHAKTLDLKPLDYDD